MLQIVKHAKMSTVFTFKETMITFFQMDEVKQKLQTKLAEYDKQHQVCVFFNIGFYYIFQMVAL